MITSNTLYHEITLDTLCHKGLLLHLFEFNPILIHTILLWGFYEMAFELLEVLLYVDSLTEKETLASKND
jgi:hypothetical protein